MIDHLRKCKNTRYIAWNQFNYAVHISLRYKYIFVETPKVACSTIKCTLQQLELNDSNLHWDEFEDIHNRTLSPLLQPSQVGDFDKLNQDKEYFKFCFVRNPYTRLLSAYIEKIKGNKLQKRSILAQLGYEVENISREITFGEFVHAVVAQPIGFMDPHWRPQYYQTFQDSIQYDHVGKFEQFDENFKIVIRKFGAKDFTDFLSTERRHASSANPNVQDYYSKALRDLVFKKYQKDFDFFGYAPDLPGVSGARTHSLSNTALLSEEDIKNIRRTMYFQTPQGIKEQENRQLRDLIKIKDQKLKRADEYLEEKKTEIRQMQKMVKWMESSRFWKMLNIYRKAKQSATKTLQGLTVKFPR